MSKNHTYEIHLKWTGNTGSGTSRYDAYERSYIISGNQKPELQGSSDPAYRGDKTQYNPEEMLLASLSACHMLWFLHLCSDKGIIVESYTDEPTGIMETKRDGSGKFTEVTLRPLVKIADLSRVGELEELHKKANEKCFIANSVNFPVKHLPGLKE